jgi:hypothetical protein
VQELVIGRICTIARACPVVPEDKERAPVHRNLSDPEGKRDQEQHHISENHPVLEAALPALRF